MPFFVLLALALAGAPLFAVIASSAMLGFYSEDTDLSVMGIEIYRLAETPVLLAIPLFTFAGYLLGESEAPARLVRLTNALLGWLTGGLAIVSLAACALFTAFTGASGVTIVALGALLYPALREAQYPERFSLGLVTTAGSLGLLFAPALPLILYGVVAQQMNLAESVKIDDLFAAGLVPGLLMVALLSIYSMWVARGSTQEQGRFSAREAWAAVRDAGWEIPLPFVVLGGIYGGFFCSLGSGRCHRALRARSRSGYSARGLTEKPSRGHARINGSGGRDSDHSWCLHGVDQLPDFFGCSHSPL